MPEPVGGSSRGRGAAEAARPPVRGIRRSVGAAEPCAMRRHDTCPGQRREPLPPPPPRAGASGLRSEGPPCPPEAAGGKPAMPVSGGQGAALPAAALLHPSRRAPADVRQRRAPALRGAGDPASINIVFGLTLDLLFRSLFPIVIAGARWRVREEGWGLDRAAPASSARSHGPSSPSWHGQGSSANGATSPPPWPKRLGGA